MAQTTEDALTTLQNAQNNAKVKQLTDNYNTMSAASAAPVATAATNTAAATPSAMTTQNRVNEINNMYDAQQAANLAQLQSGYDISRSEMQAAADKIAPQYQQQANANAVDWERQRRNFLEGAAVNGINTGASAQEQLAMMGQQQRGQNNIRTAQANAEAETGRQMANLTSQYQASIQKAIADNNYAKAGALLDEYAQGYDRDLKNAQIMAEFGDFSGYEGLYGADAAKGMADFWAQQNPDVAYVTGRITKDQYDNIRAGRPINDGLDANGVRIAGTGGGGGGGSSFGGSDLANALYQSAGWAQKYADYAANTGDAASAAAWQARADAGNRAAGRV